MKDIIIYDMELIGSKQPIMFVCALNKRTREINTYMMHKKKDRQMLFEAFDNPDFTWVSFNGKRFDQPLISMALWGHDIQTIKLMAERITDNTQNLMPWDVYKLANIEAVEFDHIDLYDVAPGVMISLKAYAGRMGYPTMVDMPFHHDHDMSPREQKVAVAYCMNDLGVTEWLFDRLQTEIKLREQMGEEYGLDLRSKSDAQVAEAILKSRCGISNKDKRVPLYVEYRAPDFIQTDSEVINEIVAELETHKFAINRANGNVISPDFLEEPIQLGFGTYQLGVGGIHSTHDQCVSYEATEQMMISDIDAVGYYPKIMIKAGLIPRFSGNKGELFLAEYENIYQKRVEAKRAGNKQVANTLKIVLNGTFGKLGNIYCSFYSPDLMLAVTLTGQLNLLCLIHELEKIPKVRILSANTDGIMLSYPKGKYNTVCKTIAKNAKRTGFEYEETPYETVALKDVNNYLAVTEERTAVIVEGGTGKIIDQKIKPRTVKSKGLYASNDPAENPLYLMKNPTMEVCSKMAREFLKDLTLPEDAIHKYTDMRDFVAIRNVKGGGIQFDKYVLVDDWVLVKDLGTKDNEWVRQAWLDSGSFGEKHHTFTDHNGKPLITAVTPGRAPVKRKSRPPPVEVGVGGKPFGRVARWYMTTKSMPPLSHVDSGNKVPKTEGARICLTLPEALPDDLDLRWYINETYRMLGDMGVQFLDEREKAA